MPDLFLGLDIGTSGARTVAIDKEGTVFGEGQATMAEFGTNHRSPEQWWRACEKAVKMALAQADVSAIRAVAVDGTSGTMVPVNSDFVPLADGLMYNDICANQDILGNIRKFAPDGSPAVGANSALARALIFMELSPAFVLHQADWVACQFSAQAKSDENNALKTGYDLNSKDWPDWICATGLDHSVLPEVVEPGTVIGSISPAACQNFGLRSDVLVVAGTTDGCASFVATGADQTGDGVTALGTTMTIKLLSDRAISAPQYGIYAHRILGKWLVGGASNTGGRVLLKYFDADRLKCLSDQIDPEEDCSLDYYPLAERGERFPVNDPKLEPRVSPRPDDDAEFLKGLLDGIARIEAQAYARLHELGAPKLSSVRTVGGGARNGVWSRLRERRLGVEMKPSASNQAAYGAALLAMRGAS